MKSITSFVRVTLFHLKEGSLWRDFSANFFHRSRYIYTYFCKNVLQKETNLYRFILEIYIYVLLDRNNSRILGEKTWREASIESDFISQA